MVNLKASVLDDKGIKRALVRISHEIVEKNKGVENVVLVGVRRRGEPIAQRISKNIEYPVLNTVINTSQSIEILSKVRLKWLEKIGFLIYNWKGESGTNEYCCNKRSYNNR